MKKQLTGKIVEIIKNVKYNIIVNMGRDEQGNYPRRTRIFYGTERQAQTYLSNWIYELEHPELIPSTETVGEWLDFWLENDVKLLLNWEQNTERRAKGIVKHNLKPNIGDILLVELNADDILLMYKKLSVDGGRGEKPLSQRSIRYVHTILNQSLKQAVVRKKIKDNPANGLAPANKKEKAYKKWVVLDGEQLAIFLEAIEYHRDYIVILCAAYTGARQSELLGLTWENISEEELSVSIEKALHKTYEEDEEEEFELRDRTKNATSTRTIGVSQKLIFALNLHRDKQNEKGIGTGPTDLIFTESDGRPMDADSLSARYRKLAKKHGHKGMTFHHLRHTHATILLTDGAYINEVAQRLGHADPRITLSTYGHVLPKRMHSLAERFDKLVTKKEESKPENGSANLVQIGGKKRSKKVFCRLKKRQ